MVSWPVNSRERREERKGRRQRRRTRIRDRKTAWNEEEGKMGRMRGKEKDSGAQKDRDSHTPGSKETVGGFVNHVIFRRCC